MPIGPNNTFKISDSEGNNSASRVLAIFEKNYDNSFMGRQNKAIVVLQGKAPFEAFLNLVSSGTYQKVAGADLSNILFPYIARSSGGVESSYVNSMPNFGDTPASNALYAPVNLYSLMPYKFENTEGSGVYNTYLLPSGDSYKGIVSNKVPLTNVDQYRDFTDQRSVGLRLPAVAVGWGYTTWGDPFPSGSVSGVGHSAVYNFSTSVGSGNQKRSVPSGYLVDPQDYVAAPIDLRYDPVNHVWTAPKGFWAEISSEGSGIYAWREVRYGVNGVLSYASRSGNSNLCPAIEANHDSDASGIVYLYPKEYKHYHMFVKGGGGTQTTPSAGQYQYQVYQMTSNNAVGWDYVRAHP